MLGANNVDQSEMLEATKALLQLLDCQQSLCKSVEGPAFLRQSCFVTGANDSISTSTAGLLRVPLITSL